MSEEVSGATEGNLVSGTDEVVDHLRGWAEDSSVIEVPYVAGLLQDLPEGRNMTMWSSRDPFEHLPHPELTKALVVDRIAKVLTVLRNVLVFVPVAVTWLAISRATKAFVSYSDMLAVSQADMNFLQFWQGGGPGGEYLAAHWRIGFVATLDFGLIVLIIVATLVASLVHAAGQRARKTEQLEIDTRRQELAIKLGIALAGKHWATPESIAESVQDVVNRLTDTVHLVVEATGRLDDTARTVLEASLGVSGLASHMDSLSASSTQLGTRLEGVSEQIAGEITRAVTDLGQAVNEFRSAATADTARAVQAVADFRISMANDSTEAMEAVAHLSSSVSEETARNLETIRGFNNAVADEVLGMLNEVVAGLENINDRLEDSSERLVASNRSVSHGTDRLRQDLDGISQALGRMMDRFRSSDE